MFTSRDLYTFRAFDREMVQQIHSLRASVPRESFRGADAPRLGGRAALRPAMTSGEVARASGFQASSVALKSGFDLVAPCNGAGFLSTVSWNQPCTGD